MQFVVEAAKCSQICCSSSLFLFRNRLPLSSQILRRHMATQVVTTFSSSYQYNFPSVWIMWISDEVASVMQILVRDLWTPKNSLQQCRLCVCACTHKQTHAYFSEVSVITVIKSVNPYFQKKKNKICALEDYDL